MGHGGDRALLVAGLTFASAAPSATAQPVDTQPPPPAPGAQPQTAPSLTQNTVDRHGLVVLAGFIASDGSTFPRLDVILPVPLAAAPRLRIGVNIDYAHASAALPDGTDIDAYGLVVVPSAYYDWRLPIATTAGDFVVSTEGGVGIERLWLKVDQAFMPGSYKTYDVGVLRMAAAAQFRAHNGLVVSVQPLGFDVPLTSVSSANGTGLSTKTAWEGALLCGYQFP